MAIVTQEKIRKAAKELKNADYMFNDPVENRKSGKRRSERRTEERRTGDRRTGSRTDRRKK